MQAGYGQSTPKLLTFCAYDVLLTMTLTQIVRRTL